MHLQRSPAPATPSRAGRPRIAGWWRRPFPAAPARREGPGIRPRSQTSFRALAFFTIVLILAPQETWHGLAPLHLALVAALVAAWAHVNERFRHREPLLAGGRESPLALALAAWAALSIPFSLWPSGSLEVLTSRLLKSLFLFLLLGAALDTASKLRRLVWVLTLASLPLSLTALSHFVQGQFIGGGRQVVERIVGYQAGLSSNPNDLALLLNLILPLAAALLFSEKRALKQALLVLAIALAGAAVVVTFSRTGFLTLATVLLGLAWRIRQGPHRALLWGAPLLLGLGLLLLPPGYLVHLVTITDASSDPTGSAQDRWRDMRLTLSMVMDHPLFGAGLGMDAVALNAERTAVWTSVHNVYLQYATDLGLPGLSLFLALFWGCWSGLRTALRRLRGGREPERLALFELTYGLQVCLIGFAVGAFFHPVAYHFPFFYFAGLAVAARGVALEES